MRILKTLAILLLIFVVSAIAACFFEEDYHWLVRYFFKLFNGEHISFYGKGFHIFSGWWFVIAFGLFCVLLSVFIPRQKTRLVSTIIFTVLIFLAVTALTSFTDSKLTIMECTACRDNKLLLNTGSINYSAHFTTSLVAALLPFGIAAIRQRKRNKEQAVTL